jgi:SAM-dependent methyltransferase
MKYEPIKHSVGKVFNKNPLLRKLLYHLLDLLLLRAWHIRREIKKIGSVIPGSSYILDAGAGFGQYSYFIARRSKKYKILGVEINPIQVDDNNAFFKSIGKAEQVKFSAADLTTFKNKEAFDFILTVDVMEHILEDEEVFKNFYYSIKPGGILLISTPSDKGGSDAQDEHDESFIGEHVRNGYNINDIQQKLRKAGFSGTEAKYTYGKPGQISWKLSMKYPISLLNIHKMFFVLLPFYFIIAYPFSYVLNFFDLYGSHKTGTGLMVKAWK